MSRNPYSRSKGRNSMPTPNSNTRSDGQRARGVLSLCLVLILVVACWGYILPQIAALPSMQQKFERLEDKGIDPNAFFYSDHPRAFEEYGSNPTRPDSHNP